MTGAGSIGKQKPSVKERCTSSLNVTLAKYRGGRVAPPATIYYNEYNGLACRGGIYAARRSRPDNAVYRVNRTGRIYASPTNLPKKVKF